MTQSGGSVLPIGERVASLEADMDVVKEGVANFRDFKDDVKDFISRADLRAELQEEQQQKQKDLVKNLLRIGWKIAAVIFGALLGLASWAYHEVQPVLMFLWDDYKHAHPSVTTRIQQHESPDNKTGLVYAGHIQK